MQTLDEMLAAFDPKRHGGEVMGGQTGLQGSGSGDAARAHLAAGRAIYYSDARQPEGLVKKYPDGRMQLVSVGIDGKIIIIRDL